MRVGRKLGERARAAATPVRERLLRSEASEDRAGREPPAPPEGPRSVYARVLDGDSLWLAVTGTRERIGLRREGTAEILFPASDAPPDDAVTSLRWHLPTVLPGADGAAFEVVTEGGEPVRSEPLPDEAPMRTPPSRDGRWQFAVRRRAGGALVVRRDPDDPAAEVVDVRLEEDGVAFTLTDPGLGDARLHLVTATGTPVAELPVARSGDLLTATVRAASVPPESGVSWYLALAGSSSTLPVRRRRNDNAMPGRSAALPLLWTGEGETRSMVRFQYQLEGRIRVSRPTEPSAP